MANLAKSPEVFLSKPVLDVLVQAFGELETKAEAIGKNYADAADTGSAHHENGPGEFWREQMMFAEGKLKELRAIRNSAKIYEPAENPQKRVQLGSAVRVDETYPESDQTESTYTIVSPYDVTVCAKLSVGHPRSWISSATPVGKALLDNPVSNKDIIASLPRGGQVRMVIRDITTGDFDLVLPMRQPVDQKPS